MKRKRYIKQKGLCCKKVYEAKGIKYESGMYMYVKQEMHVAKGIIMKPGVHEARDIGRKSHTKQVIKHYYVRLLVIKHVVPS